MSYYSRGNNNAAMDGDEKEIASRTLQIQSKRFYLDVKQNRRGRFFKLAEVGASGQKSRILMGMSSTAQFRDKLNLLAKHLSAQPAAAAGDAAADFKSKSETMAHENRRYFLDLRENQRGRYLRIAQQVAPSGVRSQVVVPEQGVRELADLLVDLINQCGTDDAAEGVAKLPEAKALRAENKMFYFDVGYNRLGTFLRMSEVRQNFRTAVTLPEKSWQQLRDILTEYIDQVAGNGGGTATVDAVAVADAEEEDDEQVSGGGSSEDESSSDQDN
ncbi:hypothetical protein BOX15_Mlig023747g1 [Macrostomum lignano]|uniref:Transcriptional activator protein Pur-alpha n=1 Tax=Macrostomum lignano TaxID=282301 RepID=A0A267DPT5_9PLAT|nr:hypothetical protein BOX15_Mlig023747g1 [Macrostomum lignano]